MPTLVKISGAATSTSGLFSETNNALLFEIRPPQRRFKWRNRQIDQLWQDIVAAYKANRASYFLGTLLLVRSDDSPRVSVIDGQQRITTLSLLLAVLRDHCRQFDGLQTRADGIQRLITRVDNDGRPVGPLVVTLQEPDNAVFVKLVDNPGSTKRALSQKDLLSRAVERLTVHVEEHIDVPDREERLRKLCEYIQERIEFLPIEVGSESEGFLVFDTTNTRGLRPSPAEALKARLATTAREDKNLSEDLMRGWNAAAVKLEGAGLGIDAMVDFIHAIWSSKEGYTPKRTLDTIAPQLAEHYRLREFVRDLGIYCDSYLAVVAPQANGSLTEDIRDLNFLNVQSRSLLMAVHKNSPDRFEKAVDLVLSLQIRNVTVGPQQANEYEKNWPEWAVKVRDGRTQEALEDIRSRLVPDEEFRRRFEAARVRSPRTVRHLLRRLDPISRPGSGVQPVDVDVEHVLPRSLVEKLMKDKKLTKNVRNWIVDLGHEVPNTTAEKQALARLLEPYLNMLGNQALLNDKVNRGAKDLPFLKKKVLYSKQALELTKGLAKHENWGLERISERQKQLAKQAVNIWRK